MASLQCVVPENIHDPPRKATEIPEESPESKRRQFLRELGVVYRVFFQGKKYKYQDINIKCQLLC